MVSRHANYKPQKARNSIDSQNCCFCARSTNKWLTEKYEQQTIENLQHSKSHRFINSKQKLTLLPHIVLSHFIVVDVVVVSHIAPLEGYMEREQGKLLKNKEALKQGSFWNKEVSREQVQSN